MQPKRPRFNPLILALALAGVLMIWSVLGTSDSSTGGSTMSYSTVVHYFENNQVTAFTLDRNTSIITLTLKEGKQELPETTGATAATQASGGLLSNLFSSSTSSVGATRNDDGTVTVRYKLPYAYVFIENVQQYIDSYDAANPTAPRRLRGLRPVSGFCRRMCAKSLPKSWKTKLPQCSAKSRRLTRIPLRARPSSSSAHAADRMARRCR